MEKKITWHNLSFKEISRILDTDIEKGLSEKEIKIRQKKFGKNLLPKEKTFSSLKIFLEQFRSPLVYILIIAGIITLVLKEWTDTVVILGAVFINTIFGFLEEKKVSKILIALKKVLKIKTIVLREEQPIEIFQEEVVPGDIILLKSGDRIPADGRLVEASNLKINEAVLSGEWLPASKSTKVLFKETSLVGRDNMVYMGTTVEDGQGKAIVTAIRESTEIGKIAALVKETKEERTPLQKKLGQFAKVIGIMIVIICASIFLGGVIREQSLIQMFEASVAIAVGGIPEALPIVIVVILTVGMERILKKKGLVRKLASVETLGSTSIICTDKTRTLTAGIMKMGEIVAKDLNLALEIAIFANEAFIENPEDLIKNWRVRGTPTDRALIIGAAKKDILRPRLKKEIKIISRSPFNPSYKFLATFLQKDNKKLLYVCGAPETLMDLSQNKEDFPKDLDRLAKKGMRVIGVAYKELENKNEKLKVKGEINNLIFVGLIALKDPLRKGVKKAIKICENAGIKPIIVTGDYKKTAKAIAEELGMKIKEENIAEGKDLDKMSDEELIRRLEKIKIYARAESRHKIKIIKAWQDRKEVVAMTGDGVNDAPALKKADIGIAMGSGTEVAKEASDIVLLDDSFNVIVKAVEQGRIILDNVRKSIAYILADSFTSVALIGSAIILGWPLPILPVQILWNNIIEDTLPDIAYAFEPEEKGVMKRNPTPLKAPLLNKEMKVLIFGTGLIDELLTLFLFWLLWSYLGMSLSYARTMVFGAICIDTAFVIYCYKNLRKNIWQINIFSNKWLVLSSILVFTTFALAIYVPPFQLLLKTVPLGIGSWVILILIGLISMFIIEITKWYFIVRHQTEV